MFKIYVGNLDYKVKVEQLRELFSVYAPIEDLVIPTDPKTNRAKGFAIVMIRDAELGRAAVKAMQGKRLLGRLLVVNEAVKKKKPGQPVLTKADLVRNGPFGPRMYRMGDPRSRTSRNPRRGHVGGLPGAPTPLGSSPSPAPNPSLGSGGAAPTLPGAPASTGSGTPPGGRSLTSNGTATGAARQQTPATPILGGAASASAGAAGSPARPMAPVRPVAPASTAPKPTAPAAGTPGPGAAATPAPTARPKAQRLATPKRAATPDAGKNGAE